MSSAPIVIQPTTEGSVTYDCVPPSERVRLAQALGKSWAVVAADIPVEINLLPFVTFVQSSLQPGATHAESALQFVTQMAQSCLDVQVVLSALHRAGLGALASEKFGFPPTSGTKI